CRCWQRLRYDHVHLEPDQLGREVGQPVELTLRISIVDDNILTLTRKGDISEGVLPPRKPIRGTFPTCCASAASAARMLPPTTEMNARRSITAQKIDR